ncbi:4,5-DOPA dioxygenase extradiol [Noviherbaspirillum sp.]|uniref:4,5-DOPA-extradiol-dioxygenase n=1 Tax=Noviherbaspirillum sp. TaxID=1926288 RepID=UPI002D6F2646|nr:4,5-DOPA dioxygenase extradiol [Noviherbaspirillum sp.]HZW23297.1 4,5-DOPA dioxygenase extradiol [Noviherbaspirillum sp.]
MMDTGLSHRLPAIFVGHGSPMNALEDNAYTQAWARIGQTIPKPKAILAVSAHWYTHGTAVTAMETPRTIHDFGGFPQALFDMRYPAPGSPPLAGRVRELLQPVDVRLDHEWGLDHGTWSVLVKMYPDADIPVVQLSIDANQPPSFHLETGRRLAALRDEGVLLLATGDIVHNLRTMRWGSVPAYDWAARFNQEVRDCLLRGDMQQLAAYEDWGHDAHLSVPTPEHFLPLLYIAGAKLDDEPVSIPVDGIELGSVSMMVVAVGKLA